MNISRSQHDRISCRGDKKSDYDICKNKKHTS